MQMIREWVEEQLDNIQRRAGNYASTREGIVCRLVALCELMAWSYGMKVAQPLHPRFFDSPDPEEWRANLDQDFVMKALAVAREAIREVQMLGGPPDGES